MQRPEDTFAAPPLTAANAPDGSGLPASVPVPGHGAPAVASPGDVRVARLEGLYDAFVRECRAIGGRDSQIAIQNADQALMWARRALKVG